MKIKFRNPILSDLKKKLIETQAKESQCISQEGFVIGSKRYEYQELIRESKRIKQAIEQITKINNDVIIYR